MGIQEGTIILTTTHLGAYEVGFVYLMSNIGGQKQTSY